MDQRGSVAGGFHGRAGRGRGQAFCPLVCARLGRGVFRGVLTSRSPICLLYRRDFRTFIRCPVEFKWRVKIFIRGVLDCVAHVLGSLSVNYRIHSLGICPFSTLAHPFRVAVTPRARVNLNGLGSIVTTRRCFRTLTYLITRFVKESGRAV